MILIGLGVLTTDIRQTYICNSISVWGGNKNIFKKLPDTTQHQVKKIDFDEDRYILKVHFVLWIYLVFPAIGKQLKVSELILELFTWYILIIYLINH